MRILCVCPKYYPRIGGVATHVRNIAERLAGKHDVTVFVTNTIRDLPVEEELNGVRIRRFGCIAPHDSYNLSFTLCGAVRKVCADIVHIHGYDDLTPFLTILLKNRRQKCLFTLHSGGSSSEFRKALRIPYNMIMSKIMQNVDRIICVSEFELQHFQRVLRLPREKFAFVPNGVDCEEIRGNPCRKTSSYSLLSVGRLEKYKGHHRVLRGFKSFKVLHPDIKIDLCIVGNGPYKSSLQRESELLGLHDYVHFVSWLPQREYRSLLKESLALVLLSDYESQSIVVSESLCARTPVIVSDNSALADYVRQNLALGVANPDDPREVASKIESLLSGTYGQRTHNYNPASWEDVVARLIRIYQEVLTSDGNKHPR